VPLVETESADDCHLAVKLGTITIARRYRGPASSGNGGYVCGRLAGFIPGVVRVRLRVPPPLDVPLDVRRRDDGVILVDPETEWDDGEGRLIGEAWPASLELDIPPSPGIDASLEASGRYAGFDSHRFSTCFVCGTDRESGDALRIFAGPVKDRSVPGMVACGWTPDISLASDGVHADSLYVWCALDCPGGFSFPHPEEGTILLGELTVAMGEPVLAGRPHVVAGWEIERKGRKHYTGTAVYTETGACAGFGYGVWFEVPEL
jgi:hypothetical protein